MNPLEAHIDYLTYLANPTMCADPAAAAEQLRVYVASAIAEAGETPRARLLAEAFELFSRLNDILLNAMSERAAVVEHLKSLLKDDALGEEHARQPTERRRVGRRRRCR